MSLGFRDKEYTDSGSGMQGSKFRVGRSDAATRSHYQNCSLLLLATSLVRTSTRSLALENDLVWK